MSRIRLALSIFACSMLALPATARNDRYTFPIQGVLDSPDFNKEVGNSVKFVFGDQQAIVEKQLGEYIANDRQHFHGKSEEGACQDTLISALSELSDHAKRAGGDAVIGIVSYFRRKTFSSTTEYECHAGSNGVFVSLKGTIVTLQK